MIDKLIQKENLNETFCYMDNLTVAGRGETKVGNGGAIPWAPNHYGRAEKFQQCRNYFLQ